MVIKFNAGQSIPAPLAVELGGIERIRKFMVSSHLFITIPEGLALHLHVIGAKFSANLTKSGSLELLAWMEMGEPTNFENVEFPQLCLPPTGSDFGCEARLYFGRCEFSIPDFAVSKVREWLHVAQTRIKHKKSGLGRGLWPWFLYSDILEGTALSIPDDYRDVIPARDLERRMKQNDKSDISERHQKTTTDNSNPND